MIMSEEAIGGVGDGAGVAGRECVFDAGWKGIRGMGGRWKCWLARTVIWI